MADKEKEAEAKILQILDRIREGKLGKEQKELLKTAVQSTLAMPENADLRVAGFPNLPTIPYPKRSKKQERKGRTTPIIKAKRGLLARILGL